MIIRLEKKKDNFFFEKKSHPPNAHVYRQPGVEVDKASDMEWHGITSWHLDTHTHMHEQGTADSRVWMFFQRAAG